MPGEMQLEVPQQTVVARHEQTDGQGQQLPALHEAVARGVALAVH